MFGQNGSVSGYVKDAQSTPVSFANVMLLNIQDSTIVKGTSTDDHGFYKINAIPNADYILKVSFIGYDEVMKQITVDKDVHLEAIVLMESSETLDEISITATKPTVKKEADKLTFNVENTALIEGNMLQVLKNTPGILVLDNNITVKNTVPTVFINNRKVNLTSSELSELLEGSSASAIKSVEVITNPSARYDADSGVVINIVMSKNLITGYSGNVFANVTQGVFPRYNAGMSHFFKSEKINFFANYSYTDSKINRNDTHNINYFDNNQTIDEIWRSKVNRNTWSETHNLNFNFDYAFDDKNTLSVSSNMLYLPYFKQRITGDTDVFDSNQNRDFYFDATNWTRDDKYTLGFDLGYVHLFKKEGEKLSFNAHYTTYDYQRQQDVFSNYYLDDNTFIENTAFNTRNTQDTEIFTAQADYILPIGESATFETGIKSSQITTNSSINQFDVIAGENVLDVNNSDAFDYDEAIFAGYVSFSKNWEKWNLTTGLRTEQTNVEGYSISNNETNTQDYLEWFPSMSLTYNATENFSVYTNYKRSIQRPDYQSLNPFKLFLNDNTIVVGNPNLQPVIVNHGVVGTTLFGNYTVEAYYKTSKNNSFELPRQNNEESILTYVPVNLDETVEFGFDFSTYFNVLDNWSIYFVTSFYNVEDKGLFDGNSININQWSNFSQLSHDFTFLKDQSLSANVSLTYVSKNLQYLSLVDEMLLTDVSISKTILKKQGVISLSASGLFNTQNYNINTRYLNQFSSSRTELDNRFVRLGFRYKFGNTRLETNQRYNTQQETDRLNKKQ